MLCENKQVTIFSCKLLRECSREMARTLGYVGAYHITAIGVQWCGLYFWQLFKANAYISSICQWSCTTLGEFTPSYILHTRAFGTYLLGGLGPGRTWGCWARPTLQMDLPDSCHPGRLLTQCCQPARGGGPHRVCLYPGKTARSSIQSPWYTAHPSKPLRRAPLHRPPTTQAAMLSAHSRSHAPMVPGLQRSHIRAK